jgi:uncharacterized repeat protein (TIGR02543 family)
VRAGATPVDVAVRFLGGRTLTVALEGAGEGAVTLGDAVLCARTAAGASGRCAEVVPHGARVTLQATSGARAAFRGWGGDCASATTVQCSVTLAEGRRVTATFAPLRRVTIVADSGDGAGRVTGGAGLDCRIVDGVASGSCAVDVVEGETVELRAVPEGGAASRYALAGWGGACSAAAGSSCRVQVGADREVRVRFVGEPRVRVELTGPGGGQVTSALGIDCQLAGGSTVGTCEGLAPRGATVTLTARPDQYSVFVGWTGACAAVTIPVCTVTVTEARTVRATFALRRVTLTVQLLGPVSGSVQVNGTTSCALAAGQGNVICRIGYDAGTLLQLSAVAGSGARFVGFGSTCSGTAPCLLTIAHDRVVTATFEQAVTPPPPPPPPPTVAFAFVLRGGGDGSVLLNGATVCSRTGGVVSGPCLGRVAVGSTVTVTIALGSSARFEGWEGACAGQTGLSCILTATRDETLTLAIGRRP